MGTPRPERGPSKNRVDRFGPPPLSRSPGTTIAMTEAMKEDLRATRWNRLAIRIQVPPTTGVFLLETGGAGDSDRVLLVGSATNLRQKLLELADHRELKGLSARVIHWVADLSIEQARLAERLFIRRYNPPLNLQHNRYLDILAG